MKENIYSRLPKLKVHINLSSIVAFILVMIFGFLIPVSYFQNLTQQNNGGGQVAGISTNPNENSIILPILNKPVSLEGQSGVLISVGLVLIISCIVITALLLIDFIKHRKL
jgi:hypothetical protein